ncbi:MAG: hypothetical protein IJF33_03300 [Clostridia bacterium]|nr:hypothetical protein [Clostridia bacterium]
MNNEQNRTYKKDSLLQTAKIVVLAVLAIALLLLTALELLPTAVSNLKIGKKFQVSSAWIDVSRDVYSSHLVGEFVNDTNETIVVDALAVTVSDGKVTKKIELDGFALPPRTDIEISETWTGIYDYDRITRIDVTVNGKEDVLVNTDSTLSISGIAIVYLLLLLVDLLLLVRACKIRYYIWQEQQLQLG